MQKIKAFGDWLTKWFTVIVIVWAVFNYFVPQTSLWGKSYTGYFLGIVLFGMGLTLTLDDFKRILTQPLMVVVGDQVGAFGSYRDGCEIIGRAASKKKELVVLEGWSHYDLYDRQEPVGQALAKLIPFYRENL